MKVLVCTDAHFGDKRGQPALSPTPLAQAVNDYGADQVINLNDTIGPLHQLDPGDTDPIAHYLGLWQQFQKGFNQNIKGPLLDIPNYRDAARWDQIAQSPPYGCTDLGTLCLLWLATDKAETSISQQQWDWLEHTLRKNPGRIWVVACHMPLGGSFAPADDKGNFLENSDYFRDLMAKYATFAVYAAGHYHLPPNTPPYQTGNTLLVHAGALNYLRPSGHSFAKGLVFKTDTLKVENLNLTSNQTETTWSFTLPT